MADVLPQKELCPHCKKQFKRLKSHLPYCKKVETILPFNSDITNSKAAFFLAPKLKELQKKRTKAEGEEACKRKNINLIKVKHSADLDMRNDVQTSAGMKKQIKMTLQMTQNSTIPKRGVFLAENGHMLSAAKKYSKAKLTNCLPKSGEDKSKSPSGILRGSPSKHSSTDEDKKHSSSLPNDIRIEHPEQKQLTETLDLPFSIYEIFPRLDRSQNPCGTLQSNERGTKARDPISEASHSINNSETQRRNTGSFFSASYINSLYKTLQSGGMENHSIQQRTKQKEFPFDLEAAGKGSWNKRFEDNKSPVVEVPKSGSMRAGPRKQVNNNDLATEKIPHHDNQDSTLLPSGKLACEEILSSADLGNQSLSTLVLKYLQEEEDGHKTLVTPANPVDSKKPISSEPDPDPKTWAICHQQPLNPAWHCAPKTLTNGHVEGTGNKNLPTSLGLEWFPELYPGYLHLGVLSGRPQKGNIEVQKSYHNLPEAQGFLQGEDLSAQSWQLDWNKNDLFKHLIPILERSLMDIKMGKLPSWLTISNFSLMGLLGKVQKAWIKYPKFVSLKKGSVGGITMLFAGYWVLCYSWSFKHLKLQRWRKHH